MAYSLERKAAVLAKMLPPNNVALHQLSQEEGISKSTLCLWRAEAREKGKLLPVTSRKNVRLFLEQLRFDFVPVLHGLQWRLAAEG